MGKNLNTKDLARGRASRSLLAVSLAVSLAAFGCTTNHNLGNGTPVRSGGEMRSAPSSGVTSGQERATTPPMTSSYMGADVLPRIAPRSASRADRAAAILAGNQPARGRYLGIVNPGPAGRPYASDANGQFVNPNPALATNPQLTLNSSISSGPVAGINTGVGSTVLTNGTTVTTGAATTTAGTTATTAASTVAGATAIPTATAAGGALPAGAFAASTFTPAESIIANSTVTAASAGTAATVSTPTVTAATGNALATSGSVVLVRGVNGAATITNTPTTSTGNQ